MSAYNSAEWKNINGQYQTDDPRRYADKKGALQTGFTGSELQCYERCNQQPESQKRTNEFKSSVNTISNKCYCSFRPKSKAQKAEEKREPTVVELNVKQFEFEMMMREYRNLYDKYLNMVAANTKEDNKLEYNKNVAEFAVMNPKVRYVRIQQKNMYVIIQEIEVIDETGKNVAFNQSKETLHWYTDCTKCEKNICDSKNYKNMSHTDIMRNYFGASSTSDNSRNNGGPGTVEEIGCCEVNENLLAIRDTSNGAIYGIGKKPPGSQNKTTVKMSSTIWNTVGENVINGIKSDNQSPYACAGTEYWGNQYIELDLNADVDVRKVNIYAAPGYQYYLNGARLLFYNNKRELVTNSIKLTPSRSQSYDIQLKTQPKIGFIRQLFLNNVSQKQCFDDCAHDDNCKYVLFHKEKYNNGSGDRTRNRCLKYDDSAKGLISVGNKDKQFQFTAWTKDTWQDLPNQDVKYGTDWSVNLGPSTSLKACKDTAVNSSSGPFSSVVFIDEKYHDDKVKNTCFGNALNGTPNNIKESVGVHSSIPPGGETGKIDDEEVGILNELIDLNKKISSHMETISQSTEKIMSSSNSNKLSSQAMSSVYDKNTANNVAKKLANDRKELVKMIKDIDTTEEEINNLELQNASDKMKYVLYVLCAILLITLCVLYLSDSISTKYIIYVVTTFIVVMYYLRYSYYNSAITSFFNNILLFISYYI